MMAWGNMKRNSRNNLCKVSILLILIIPLLFTPTFAKDFVRVRKVIDGDTILLNNGEKVRLIGVDTPETKHPQKSVQRFGKEAYLFTKRMAEGKEVRLEFDWQKRDKYGRLLAYVYLLDGTFLNAEIIKQGYGFAYTRFPFKYLEEFRKYEREARENKMGLWK
jgi:micrococcal nuclease